MGFAKISGGSEIAKSWLFREDVLSYEDTHSRTMRGGWELMKREKRSVGRSKTCR